MNQRTKTLLFLTTLAAASIHVINRIQYSHATIHNTLSCTSNHYYEWRFGKIRYTKQGSGTPVLLIHDLTLGSSSHEFNKLIPTLSKDHEVYAIDLLGYGLSDKPNITFTNFLYVQMLSDFIKNVIGRKTNVIATGDSFPIAVMMCHNDQEAIRNIITINPQSLYQLNLIPSKQTRILKLLMDTPIVGTLLYNMHTSKTAFTKLFQDEYYYNPYNIEEKDINAYVEAAHTPDYHSKHAHASYIGRYTNANIVHALKEINHNIYIIAGKEKDEIQTTVDNYCYYNNAIEATFIPDTKHLPHMEQPEAVLNYLEIYLD